jgi:hypothetical protein
MRVIQRLFDAQVCLRYRLHSYEVSYKHLYLLYYDLVARVATRCFYA